MSIALTYVAILDPSTHAMRVHEEFVLGTYASREAALQAMRVQGWKLPEPGGHPEPPATSTDAAG
jgi:hypothetical protein